MKNIIDFNQCVLDFDNLEKSDFEKGIKIMIYSDVNDLLISNDSDEDIDGTIFGLWVEIGEKTIMVDVGINELELFAGSILNHVEIIRKHYSKQIAIQVDKGCDV